MSLRPLLLLPAVLALAACASQPDAGKPAAGSGTCNADPAQSYLGKPASDAHLQAAFKASGATTMRSLKPGQPMTMDYRQDRVNILQDASGNIERISCG